ncbi:DUF1189 family protein [Oceanobacillus senegalensis]|uniref:DUF1189 family protein n=1 Tax=Oceanobacillus senegalensis TaxID=1936063 RepID=UPI000A30FEBD|nr:DUF1189 family protein [Oceanobacillus senegalensis]
MIFWHVFKKSIQLPNKKALFSLNRVGLDIAVFYIFILLFIVSIPTLVDRMTDTTSFSSNINVLFKLIYFFIFYYLPLTIIVFALISIIAYFGKIITHIVNRKLHYSLLWKMTAFTLTIPLLLYSILAFFFSMNNLYLLLAFIYTMGLLVKMIMIYPKRRVK